MESMLITARNARSDAALQSADIVIVYAGKPSVKRLQSEAIRPGRDGRASKMWCKCAHSLLGQHFFVTYEEEKKRDFSKNRVKNTAGVQRPSAQREARFIQKTRGDGDLVPSGFRGRRWGASNTLRGIGRMQIVCRRRE